MEQINNITKVLGDKDTTLLNDIKSLHQEFAAKYNDELDKKSKDKLIQEFTSLAENLIK